MPAPQYEQAGADIGGTGTTNTIPRWTGVSTLGDSIITQDVANSRIGINTAAPARTLHVVATTAASPARLQNTVGSFELGFDASGAYFQPNTANTGVWLYTQAGSFFGISGAALTPGWVGVGTQSPADSGGWSAGRVLDVRSASAGSSSVAYFGDSTRGTNMQIGFYGSGYGFVGTVTNHALSLRTGNVERAQIDANGNIYGTSGTTGMTNGFFYIPAAAGAPTGTPTAVSGRVPMYYDTTNNKFYVYNGAWKAVTLT